MDRYHFEWSECRGTGAMAGVLIQLGQSALSDVLTWVIALVSLIGVVRFLI